MSASIRLFFGNYSLPQASIRLIAYLEQAKFIKFILIITNNRMIFIRESAEKRMPAASFNQSRIQYSFTTCRIWKIIQFIKKVIESFDNRHNLWSRIYSFYLICTCFRIFCWPLCIWFGSKPRPKWSTREEKNAHINRRRKRFEIKNRPHSTDVLSSFQS